ncbi:MAG: endo-1,4-beta-xylanase [Chloroflexota bacterium]
MTTKPSTILKLFIFVGATLFCFGLLLFNWTTPVSNAAQNNLLTNGTFDNDTTGWRLDTGNGAVASMSVVNQELCVEVTSPGVNRWDVIVGQSNVPLVAGQLYSVDFTAHSDNPRWFITKGGLATPPHTTYFRAQEYLQEQPFQHSHQFFANTSDDSSRFEFFLGGAMGQTCFDNVSLATTAPTATPTPIPTLTPTAVPAPSGTQVDLVQNGRFDDSFTHWHNSVGNSGTASVSIANEELTYTITAEGNNPWTLILLQKYLPLTQGFNYTISFDARADTDRNLTLKVGRAVAPFTSYSSETVLVTTTAQTFTHTFTMNHPSDNCVNLELMLGARGTGNIIFDNIRLETDAAAVPPPSNYLGQTDSLTGYPLRWHGDRNNLEVGAAITTIPFHCNDIYRQTLAREYNILTAENIMKFGPLRPEPDLYSFGDADNMMAFAEQHGIDVHGHVLVWHADLPDWLENGTFTRQEMIDVLYDHIDTVMERYAGQIKVWDVVNEAVDDDNHDLRPSPWRDNIGPDYIDLAFQRAQQADPTAILIYNDYTVAGLGTKSNAVYSLVADMVGRGIPIDGVGFQMHLQLLSPTNLANFAANMARYDALGLDVYITELDVRIETPVTYSDLVNQATVYRAVLHTCLAAPNCHHLTTWGFTDAHSWIPGFFPGTDAGLPFDENYRAKPAYLALIDRLSQRCGSLSNTEICPHKIYLPYLKYP